MRFEKALELMRQGEILLCKEFKAVYRLKNNNFEFAYISNLEKWKSIVYFSRYIILSESWEVWH